MVRCRHTPCEQVGCFGQLLEVAQVSKNHASFSAACYFRRPVFTKLREGLRRPFVAIVAALQKAQKTAVVTSFYVDDRSNENLYNKPGFAIMLLLLESK
jgi:hypothetical protein